MTYYDDFEMDCGCRMHCTCDKRGTCDTCGKSGVVLHHIGAHQWVHTGCGQDAVLARLREENAAQKATALRRAWRRCSSCRGVCHWHDEAWVCDDCGDEWHPEHGKQYGAPS